MFWLNHFSVSGTLGIPAGDNLLYLGAVGLAAGASVGAWAELWWLMRSLKQRLTDFTLPLHAIMRMTGLAAAASLPAALVWWASGALPLIVTAILVDRKSVV